MCPITVASSVVLPTPLRPITLTHSPGAMVRLMLSSTTVPDYSLNIRRYNPESGAPAYWQQFEVDLPAERSVLDGILRAKYEQDGSLSIRCSCQAAICGSCGVRINGKSRLACNTKIGEAAASRTHSEVTGLLEGTVSR